MVEARRHEAEHIQRPPHSGDWHGVLPEEIAEGQSRVIVNLDTLEYIDPVKFGQVANAGGHGRNRPKDRDLPILKKATQEEWRQRARQTSPPASSSCCAIPERRGGGDIPANAAEMGGIDEGAR